MREEFAAAGAAMERRGARAEEYLAVLRGLWGGGAAEFHGEFFDFPPVVMEPPPVQSPLPVLLGGAAVSGCGAPGGSRTGGSAPAAPTPA